MRRSYYLMNSTVGQTLTSCLKKKDTMGSKRVSQIPLDLALLRVTELREERKKYTSLLCSLTLSLSNTDGQTQRLLSNGP